MTMKVKMVLPALTEAKSPLFRPIKYSLFPPLGLATLAGYLDPADAVSIQDEHVETVDLDDEPDLVVIQVYITSARRAYEIADRYRARGIRVVMGGLHVTALPDEAAAHADAVFIGPGGDTWPAFLRDLRAGQPAKVYRSPVRRHVQHGRPLASSRNGPIGVAPGTAREGRPQRLAQPVCLLRDAQPDESPRAPQVPEPQSRLRPGDPATARPRRHGERQLRL